jgi:hypothetical protein
MRTCQYHSMVNNSTRRVAFPRHFSMQTNLLAAFLGTLQQTTATVGDLTQPSAKQLGPSCLELVKPEGL